MEVITHTSRGWTDSKGRRSSKSKLLKRSHCAGLFIGTLKGLSLDQREERIAHI